MGWTPVQQKKKILALFLGDFFSDSCKIFRRNKNNKLGGFWLLMEPFQMDQNQKQYRLLIAVFHALVPRAYNPFSFWCENTYMLYYYLNICIFYHFPFSSYQLTIIVFTSRRAFAWLRGPWSKFGKRIELLACEADIRSSGIKGNTIHTCAWVLLKWKPWWRWLKTCCALQVSAWESIWDLWTFFMLH